MNLWLAILGRDVALAFRRGGAGWVSLGFFLLVMVLFGFAVGPDAFNHSIAAIACVAALLAVQLGASALLESDYEDGSLEQYLLMPIACELVLLAKLCAWMLTGALPLALAAPLAMWVSGASGAQAVFCVMLLALPALGALAIFSASLTLAVRRTGLLQAIVALPLNVPVLIFGVSAAAGQAGAFSALAGVAAMCVVLSCLSSAALIRMANE